MGEVGFSGRAGMLYTTIRGRAGAGEASWLRGLYCALVDLEKSQAGC